MAEPTHIKDILPDLLPLCRIEILDNEKVMAIMEEAGYTPGEYIRTVVEEQITEALKLVVMKTQKEAR
jgi:hypothetical protein